MRIARLAPSLALAGLAVAAALVSCGRTAELATPADAMTTATPAVACEDLYDAFTAYLACFDDPGSQPPRHDRFVLNCTQHLSAPGADAAAAAAEQCVAAFAAATPSCGSVDATACIVPPGTLAAGAPCGTAMQCASQYCVASATGTAEGDLTFSQLGGGPTSCGVCVDRVALGAPCQTPGALCPVAVCAPPVPCVAGAQCELAVGAPPVEPDGGIDTAGTCVAQPVAPAPSGVGGPCEPGPCEMGGIGAEGMCPPSWTSCQSVLHCAGVGTCAAQSPDGGACSGNFDCVGSLLCTPESVCGPGLTQGQACTVSGFNLCAGNLLCDFTSQTCEPLSFVDPGAACNGYNIFCATGVCSTNQGGNTPPPGTCPAVITDGQPCSSPPSGTPASSVCDDYATCLSPTGAADAGAGGTCVRLDPSTCR